MSVRLLDVNVLISLLDSAHGHHAAAVRWFRSTAATTGWATCPLTENGFIRIVSNVNYPNFRLTPGMAAQSLARFKESYTGIHRFWPDDVSLADNALFDLSILTGHRQTSDAYLAGLAQHNGGVVSSFDGGMPWRAVRGASANLIEKISG